MCVLEELLEGGKQRDTITYPNVKLTARVSKVGHTAKFIESKGVPGSMLHLSIADLINVMMATLSDESQFNKIKEGRTLRLRNFLVKAIEWLCRDTPKSLVSDVPDDRMEKATLLIMPTSPSKTLREAMASSLRDIVTVLGQIIRVNITICTTE